MGKKKLVENKKSLQKISVGKKTIHIPFGTQVPFKVEDMFILFK